MISLSRSYARYRDRINCLMFLRVELYSGWRRIGVDFPDQNRFYTQHAGQSSVLWLVLSRALKAAEHFAKHRTRGEPAVNNSELHAPRAFRAPCIAQRSSHK